MRKPKNCGISWLMFLIVLCIVVFVIKLIVYPPSSISSVEIVETGKQRTIGQLRMIRQCALRESKRFNGSVWQRLHVIINACAANYAPVYLRFIPFASDKSFLPLRVRSPESCNAVTLGIGNEITYEKLLKRTYPDCRFFGADPFPETADIFKPIGPVYYTAVDNTTSEKRFLNVLRHGNYDWRDGVKVTSLGDFLRSMAKIRMVHYLSMDIEGAEYRIMPYLTKEGAFEKESDNATICQISAEFHGPLSNYNVSVDAFESIWSSLLTNSPYVPMRAFPPGNHHRFHLFNMENEDCLRLFIL